MRVDNKRGRWLRHGLVSLRQPRWRTARIANCLHPPHVWHDQECATSGAGPACCGRVVGAFDTDNKLVLQTRPCKLAVGRNRAHDQILTYQSINQRRNTGLELLKFVVEKLGFQRPTELAPQQRQRSGLSLLFARTALQVKTPFVWMIGSGNTMADSGQVTLDMDNDVIQRGVSQSWLPGVLWAVFACCVCLFVECSGGRFSLFSCMVSPSIGHLRGSPVDYVYMTSRRVAPVVQDVQTGWQASNHWPAHGE